MIPRYFIDDLIARVDIVELIDSAVPLKRSGKNYSACCPFHKEKTPSFTVSPDKQFYHCFGCGQSGNAVGFMMEYYRYDFVEAVENLAARLGLEVPRERDDKRAEQQSLNKALYELLETANQHYQQQLRQAPDKERAVAYLKGRGLSGQIAKQFQLGYAPPGWNHLINSETLRDYKAEQLVLAGLSIAKNEEGSKDRALQYDRFRDRIIYPIRDSRGRCIGFGGRVLGDDKPKYLNSPETPVFNKGKELYGFYEAKQANKKLDKVIVVEGYMDVIALAQMGVNYAVATLGTAIGSDHLHLLFKSVSEVIFCFDGDLAGRQAAERALHNTLPFLQDGRQVRFLFLDDGEDPDTVVRKDGPELFEHKVSSATPFSEYLFEHLGESLDLSSMDGRASLAKQATPLINQMPKGLFYEMMIGRLAEITQLSHEVIAKSLQDAEALAEQKAAERAAFSQTPNPSASKPRTTQTSPISQKPPSSLQSEASQGYTEAPPMDYYPEDMPSEAYESGFEDSYEPGYKDQDEAPEPRISTVNKVLSYLLRQPQLALNAEIPDEVYKLNVHNIDLLVELLSYIKSSEDDNPVSTAMILGHWHNSKEGILLASLAAAEPLLNNQAWEQEFNDALQSLIKQFFHQEISLIRGTSDEEKARLKQLLEEKTRFQNA